MHWRTKAHILAILSRIPAGSALYHLLQRVGGTNRLSPCEGVGRALELVEMTRQAESRIEGAVVLEVGTGWRPFVPMVFHLLGAERIVSLDINPWLNHAYALETARVLEAQLPRISAATGLDYSILQERYRRATASQETLPKLLASWGIDYRCPSDARATGLPEQSIDLVVSSNVLEHIPLEIQRDIHSESMRVLVPGGLLVHRFNPGDHYAHGKGSLHTANFLQFSEKEWHWYGGSGLAYHNRLRASDYDALFEDVGCEVRVRRTRVDEKALAELKAGRPAIHPDYARYALDDLATDYMWVAASRPLTVAAEANAADQAADSNAKREFAKSGMVTT